MGGHRALTPVDLYPSGANAIIVVRGAQRLETHIDLWKWIERARSAIGDTSVMMIVNKTDIMNSDFDPEFIAALAEEYDCSLRMTSARTGSNIDCVFKELAARMVRFPGQPKFCGG